MKTMNIVTVVSIAAFLAGQTPAASTQGKVDSEALALLAKAKQQEQKIVSGRLKVQSQVENLSPDSIAHQRSLEQSLVKLGEKKKEAAAAAHDFFLQSRPEVKVPPQNYTFAFDAAKRMYREDGVQFNRPYRLSMAGTEFIRGDSHQSNAIEGNSEISWEYLRDRYKHPLLPAATRSVWMGRGWESFAPVSSTAEFRIVEKNAEGIVVLVRSDKSDTSANATDVKVWMDTKHGFTLTRAEYILRKMRFIQMEAVYTYDRREDGTYYPKEAVETSFHKDDTGKRIAQSRMTSHIETAEINVPVAQSEVEIEIPKGSIVRNITYNRK